MSKYQKPSLATEWLKRHLLQLGYSQSQVLEAAGLAKTSNKAVLNKLPYPNALKLLDWLAKEQNNPDLGFDLYDVFKPSDFGLVSLMAYQAPTLRDFFQTIVRYQSLLTAGMEVALNIGALECEFSYKLLIPAQRGARVDIDFSLKMIIDLISQSIKTPWLPLRTELSYPEPKNLARLHQEFSKQLVFDQSNNSIFFESYLLDIAINNADPKLLTLLRDEIISMQIAYNENDTLLARVRASVASLLASGDCNSTNISQQLNISQRSMVRHLSSLGTSLREIKTKVVIDLAKTALRNSQCSIYEIAIQLGFSETSAFDRMFKKNTGYSPHHFREKYV